MALPLQEYLHRLQSGAGLRFFRAFFVMILLGVVPALYDGLAYRGLANREAMDQAQLGRSLAEGRGYTTLFIRPLSLSRLRAHSANPAAVQKWAYPDLANPPVYPCLLAGLFKVMPKRYFAMSGEGFNVYVPELVITVLNQVLLLAAGLMLFSLAARFFDRTVAWVSATVFIGAEPFWRFSVSGLNTLLLVVILLGIVWCLVLLEECLRAGQAVAGVGGPGLAAGERPPARPGGFRPLALAALAGVLIGLGGLTRYAFAWLAVPVLFYLATFFPQRRTALVLVTLSGFLLVMSPWVARNCLVSGLPFGTSTLAALETTRSFPQDRLQRSLHPQLRQVTIADLNQKFLKNTRDTIQNDLPKLGGSWVSAFFLVGLLVPFRNPALSRLRWLLVLCLLTFMVVQPLARTNLTGESMETSPENQLILLAPLVFLFGVGLFFLLLDNAGPLFPPFRRFLVVSFCVVACLPFLLALLPPRPATLTYPPYYPPRIQQVSSWFKEGELVMSDMPWAVAWYGHRPSVLNTLSWQEEFLEVADYLKPVNGLYLTQLTTDTLFLSNWIRGEDRGWGKFLIECVLRQEIPTGFPLRFAPQGFFPDQIFLADAERWRTKAD